MREEAGSGGGKKRRIVVTGGGTGGHVFPGIAVAREILRHPEAEVLYVGRDKGPESKWVSEQGLAFSGVRASGFPRGLSLRWLTFWPDFALGCFQAARLMGSFRPGAVFSTGGYVSVPVSLSAFFRSVPLYLFEPNLAPGLAAKAMAPLSRRIFTGLEETVGSFPKGKTEWTGTPLREEILTAEKSKALASFGLDAGKTTLLLLGGSQGARALNETLAGALEFIGQGDHAVQAILMTGWTDYQKTVDRLSGCGLKTVVRPFIPNIHEAYAAADLVVARSGAMTCAEIAGRGLPALFIPYPHASGHQEANARILEKAGAALVCLEKDLEEDKIAQALLALVADPARLKAMGEAARKLAKPGAARDIAERLLEAASPAAKGS